MEVENTLIQLTRKETGGVKASRNNPNCYSKQKEIQSIGDLSFPAKPLSLENAHSSLGISENLKNSLKIRTSGDISTVERDQISEAVDKVGLEGASPRFC